MKFDRHLKEKESGEFIYLSAVLELLEAAGFDNDLLLMEAMPELAAKVKDTSNWFELLKAGAAKLGIRLKKTESLWTYLKRGGTWATDVIRLISLYMLTDVTDSATRKEIKYYAKKLFKQVNPKEVAGFLLQLDRDVFGLTGFFRHFMMSVLGIEVTAYNKWLDDPNYIEKEFEHIKQVAGKRISSKQMSAINKLQHQIVNILKDKDIEAKIAATKHLKEAKQYNYRPKTFGWGKEILYRNRALKAIDMILDVGKDGEWITISEAQRKKLSLALRKAFKSNNVTGIDWKNNQLFIEKGRLMPFRDRLEKELEEYIEKDKNLAKKK